MGLELFLHSADVSNPMKPFKICSAWAHRVLDEFFAQGDEETALCIPVGMLNDRSKVNRPGSQHGFINFLVSPLVHVSMALFHPLIPLGENMIENMLLWKEAWAEEVKPSADDINKKVQDIARLADEVDRLKARSAVTDH